MHNKTCLKHIFYHKIYIIVVVFMCFKCVVIFYLLQILIYISILTIIPDEEGVSLKTGEFTPKKN